MSEQEFAPNTPVTVNSGTKYEPFDLDISQWSGRIVGQVQGNDYLVRWDKPTIDTIPGWVIASWIETGEDWSCMELEAKALQTRRARDKEDDWFDAFCQRLQEHSILPNFLSAPAFVSEMNDYYGDDPDIEYDELLEEFGAEDELSLLLSEYEYDEYEYDEEDEDDLPWGIFDFDELVELLQIPKDQRKPLLRTLRQSRHAYYKDHLFGQELTANAFVKYQLPVPYIFGYALVAVLNNPKISRLTKVKLCQYTIDEMDPKDEDGIPFGLVNMLAFLAREGMLVMPVFGLLLFTLDYAQKGMFGAYNWLEDLSDKSEMVDLLDWLLRQQEVEEDEMLWWFWRFSTMCNEVHHSWGKAMAATWCASEVSDDTKKQLLHIWLNGQKPVGKAPLAWQMTEAQNSGDIEKLLALYEQAGITPTEEELEYLEAHHQHIQSLYEDPFFFIQQQIRTSTYTPSYLKRFAIPELVRLGESLDQLTGLYWNSEIDATLVHQGIADALVEFKDQLSPEDIQHYLEQGIKNGAYQTRHAFFRASVKLFGHKYLAQALKDESKAIRNWAQKQQAK
jgi:hypothetical protein